MDKLDKLIKEALADEDQKILQETEELGWFALGLGQFRGKLAWVSWVIITFQLFMFIVAIWCGLRFFTATEMLPALKWGISGAVLVLASLGLKLSLMPQMQADRVIREIKRVELMLAARS